MQKLAGHSTARITMEIYTHANMDSQRAAMSTLDNVFAG
jgi:integrase